MGTIEAAEVKPRLTDGSEIAFLDVREHGQYGEGHPFFVVNVPYSQLEMRIEALLPRKGIDIVLLDDDDGVAEKAAARLSSLGYHRTAILQGGSKGWADAGFTLYKGVNLPSKTLGELVEHATHTPRITAQELHALESANGDFVLLDGRSPEEFETMNISGAICCPNAELGHRLPQILSSKTTTVVVNCAGRTRSIIGAQGLINQGIENPVFALENGTQGWELAGYKLNRGARNNLPHALDPATMAASRDRGESLSRRFDIPKTDHSTLNAWQDDEYRTTYIFDVRTQEEFDAGHLSGSVHAPGGQLVQATDLKMAARGARIVLVDDTGLRAANTAVWLKQMMHEVYVLEEDVTKLDSLQTGPVDVNPSPGELNLCDTSEIAEALNRNALLIDLNSSTDYRAAHINGALWSIRPRLANLAVDDGRHIILTSQDRTVSELAAIDLAAQGHTNISYLAGDPNVWIAHGLDVVSTPDIPTDSESIDFLFFVHDRHKGNLQSARDYLAWETGLLDQLDEQERGFYRLEHFATA